MKTKRLLVAKISIAGLAVSLLGFVAGVQAAALKDRSVTVSSSAGGATNATYTVAFKTAVSGDTIGSMQFEICDSPLPGVSCAASASSGVNSNGASLAGTGATAAVTNLGGTWTKGATTGPGTSGTSVRYAAGSPQTETGNPTITVMLTGVTNPTGSNQQYYFRITTYSDIAFASQVDFGAVALSTANTVVVQGTMPESLVFCVGTTWSTNCSDIANATVDMGTFTPSATSTGTSVMGASTNAGSGYVITVNGTTMQSGANNIAACSSGCAQPAGVGSSQFGTNVVANTTPSVGADVTPTGAGYGGAAAANYNTANTFRFVSGETVASSSTVSNLQRFTNSYIVNVAGSQAAGVYTTTLTYICTATF